MADWLLNITKKIEDKKGVLNASAMNEINALIQKTYVSIAAVSVNARLINKELPKYIESKIQKLVASLNTSIEKVITRYVALSWTLSEKKGEALEQYVKTGEFGKIPPHGDSNITESTGDNRKYIYKRYGGGSADAYSSFVQRVEDDGLNLSERIYKHGKEYQSFIEDTLKETISSGKSAIETAKELINVVNPEAQGQGIYKNPKKNTLRLARNEINTAYRTADYYRNLGKWYVTGFEIHVSNKDREIDMCDELAGIYPKDFNWTKWHINCLCFRTEKLATKDEIKAMDMYDAGRIKTKPNIKYIDKIPESARAWVNENIERMSNWKHMPDFITDNKDYFD